MLEHSKYNHICSDPESNGYLLYNFLTGAMLQINEEFMGRFKNILLLTDDEKRILIENGFLTDDFDELAYLKFGNKLVCADEELLSILIAPTMACNFACPYCFEHHGDTAMDIQIQDEIVSFIENSLSKYRHKHLFVYWFGGEPLLCIDHIKNMSSRIISLAEKYNVAYSSAMSTNGYFLTPENVQILEKCQLNRIQVTLDGMKDIHDKTRVLRNGSGTFDVIVRNLKQLKTTISIHIRTNLHKDNLSEFSKLSELINTIKKENDIDILLYGAHMSVYEFNNENVESLELSISEFSEVLKSQKMLGMSRQHLSKFAFCDAAKMFSYCFDEHGNMYKCWNDIGNPKYSYDNVFTANRNGANFATNNALSFLANSFPDDKKCLDCKVLPVCMGGCIKKRVFEKRESCSPIKYNLDDYVQKKFLLEKGGVIYETGY